MAIAERQQASVHLHLVVDGCSRADPPVVDVAAEVARGTARRADHGGRGVLAVVERVCGREACVQNERV